MKTLNITSNNKIEPEVFIDPDTEKCVGFVGCVQLYDEEVYVDTRTGKGYDRVIAKLDKFIKYLSHKYNFPGLSLEDIQQNIALYILEGIPKYDPRKNTKLSTFLQMRIDRRLINEIRNQGRDLRNATILRTTLYAITCRKCDNKFILGLGSSEKVHEMHCKECGSILDNARAYPINLPPPSISESKLVSKLDASADASGRKGYTLDDLMSANSFDLPMIYGAKPEMNEAVETKTDIMRMLDGEEPIVKELLELICFQDFSVKAAAKKVGISHTSANNKLKRLRRKRRVRETFGR